MSFTEKDLREAAERLLSDSADNHAYQKPSVSQFYLFLDAQRIARAYLKAVSNE